MYGYILAKLNDGEIISLFCSISIPFSDCYIIPCSCDLIYESKIILKFSYNVWTNFITIISPNTDIRFSFPQYPKNIH